MFNIIELRDLIIHELHKHTEIPVVPTNSSDERPSAPYHTYNFITPYAPRTSPVAWTYETDNDGNVTATREEFPAVTLSLSTHSNASSEAECLNEAFKMRSWFYHAGAEVLRSFQVIVIDVGAVQDRTILQNEFEYQYRVGFDVRMRVVSTTTETVGTIEKVEIEKVEIIGEQE